MTDIVIEALNTLTEAPVVETHSDGTVVTTELAGFHQDEPVTQEVTQ